MLFTTYLGVNNTKAIAIPDREFVAIGLGVKGLKPPGFHPVIVAIPDDTAFTEYLPETVYSVEFGIVELGEPFRHRFTEACYFVSHIS